MYFNFQRQVPSVALLLGAAQQMLSKLDEGDRSSLVQAMRQFESTSTLAECSEQQVQKIAGETRLAAVEVAAVLRELGDVAAEAFGGSGLTETVRKSIDRVVQSRPAPGSRIIIHPSAMGGRDSVQLDVQSDGTCIVTFWGLSGPATLACRDYPHAWDRIDEEGAALWARKRDLLGSTGDMAWIVVPKENSVADRVIDGRSGVVAKVVGANVSVYYEGNRLGADNMTHYHERVKNAAGRLFKSYPTIARSVYPMEHFMQQFRVVGLCTDDYRVKIHDYAAVLAYSSATGAVLLGADGERFELDGNGQWTRNGEPCTRSDVESARLFNPEEQVAAI